MSKRDQITHNLVDELPKQLLTHYIYDSQKRYDFVISKSSDMSIVTDLEMGSEKLVPTMEVVRSILF